MVWKKHRGHAPLAVLGVAAISFSPVFPINTGEESKRKGEKKEWRGSKDWREKEEVEVGGTERKKKRKEKIGEVYGRKKTERKREKNHHELPLPLPVASSNSANDNSHHR